MERDPDYRFTLANERTFLAWLRTALSLLAAGVAVVQLVPAFSITGARTALGVTLGLLSVVASVGGVVRWRRVELAMRRGETLPPVRSTVVLAAGLTVVAVAVCVLLVLGAS
ncbi:DUF202 domain-containing protein [Rhodococcus antarcticus]|jgi:putative membrane protein|uniref:DUF202 domain-containing protein n=1 Tax=Rhodococcus antarcticus TaxID=2987751 RepID=A0ABY6NVJ6_9NOCA|nr:DUF202 domain-containing protein [Rhodococcus antarcticus]UZJ23409.1 DUF202 domain-containing protein [Rhodococcus antarcticus]